MKTALITGATGQAASYLTELLLQQDYQVVGLKRRTSTNNLINIQHLLDNPDLEIVEGDLTDITCLIRLIDRVMPDVIYNTAAQSHVHTSFEQPQLTWDVTAGGVLNLLEAIRMVSPNTKMIQFSSSEMWGDCVTMQNVFPKRGEFNLEPKESVRLFQDEDTHFSPNSPYAVAKLAAHNLVKVYRQSYDLNVGAAILCNYESPRRGEAFVTRKITKYVGKLYNDIPTEGIIVNNCMQLDLDYLKTWYPKLKLGNLEAKRDWGHAEDYMRAVILMSEQDKISDYVISTGVTKTVKEFLERAFKYIAIKDYSDFVERDPALYRPNEVNYLCGDSTKIRTELGWEPKYNFETLVSCMVDSDIKGEANSKL